MPRLNEEEIRNYLENLDDSEDGFDGSESESDAEEFYYQSAREILCDLEDSDCEEPDIDENIQSACSNQFDDGDRDPPLILESEQPLQEPASSSHHPRRPLVWRKRNLITREEDLVFLGNTQLPEELTQRESPLDFFTYFYTSDLIKHIVEQSNLYATQKQISNPVNIDENDLNKFLGILIVSSIIRFPNTRLYWHDKYGYELIKSTMSQKRFEKIRSIIHFNDKEKVLPKEHPDHDRIFLIRPLVDALNNRFGTVPIEQRLSIDEQMCATKMSYHIKQYLPNKPHKWGFKLYLLCSLYGYAHKFEIYTGSGSQSMVASNEPNLGESGNTVVRLARMIPRKVNHIVYFDNFYTSLPLVTFLAKEGIYSLGTVRANRLRNCKLPDKKTIMKKNIPRGYYEENVANVDGVDVSAVVWKDNKPVNLLSTYVGAEPATTVTRFDKAKKERVPISCPKVIKEYNAHMGGVDLLDSFIGRYNIKMRSRKWTMRLFYHLLDVTVINSWLIYKKVHKNNRKVLNLCKYRLELGETLCRMGLQTNGTKRGRPSNSLQNEIEEKRRKGATQPIPAKDSLKPTQKINSRCDLKQVEQSNSSPHLSVDQRGSAVFPSRRSRDRKQEFPKSPRDPLCSSASRLQIRQHDLEIEKQSVMRSDDASCPDSSGDKSASPPREVKKTRMPSREKKCTGCSLKKSRSYSPLPYDMDDPLSRQIREIHNDTRKSARIIRDSRARLLEIQKKMHLTEADVKELGERNDLLLREMERFDRLTRNIQKLVGAEVAQFRKPKENIQEYIPGSAYEPPMHHEMRMNHPTVLLTGNNPETPGFVVCNPPIRSKSEIDLTRKLSESYDMQEKLVADNADLEVKRYILYKELMTKDQNLETCRAQVKRLQGELKLMSKENSLLLEKLSKNNPEGDASAMNQDIPCQPECESDCQNEKFDVKLAEVLVEKLENYKTSTLELEKELGCLEVEVHHIRLEMDNVKQTAPGSACRGGGAGVNTCFEQPANGPPVPPMTKACGVCPPCPAPCNPNAPPTPAEKEVAKLTIQLRQTEENFKTKVTECAMLRAELLRKKEELEKEKCQHREVQNKLRELEMRFEGLATQTNMMLGSKEQAFEQEVNVSALKQCYREAREEIDELRILMREQNDQLQDYRVKYLQAQQLVEEQRRQMDMMDMDNTRISEQINLEIQRVKLKFQEKLQELAPIPELLKATQLRLKDAQQSQAIAEHNAEQLARELNCAREKVHMLLHVSTKPPEKPPEKGADEKQMALLQQRIAQLTESNCTLKSEIERLKANVIRMEESVLANEKRLQEKMHECAQLGGELDRARDEAARALARADERTETIRKCMQTTVAELERQLAASRAQVKTAEKDREELQCRMQCQIQRLNENFEQAQYRILGLQTQVQTLRRTVSSTGEGDADNQECACKTFFDNP